jgi:hypothetical protein
MIDSQRYDMIFVRWTKPPINNYNRNKPRPKYPEIIDKSQAKCLADVVMLYIRYVCSKRPDHEDWEKCCEFLYKELVRGEIIGNPRPVAAGVAYAGAVVTETGISQQDICEILGIQETSLRTAYQALKKRAKKQKLDMTIALKPNQNHM